MNSDVIVSKGWLSNMLKKMNSISRLACCGPLSNCDIGFQFHESEFNMKVNNELILHPAMKIGEIVPHLDDLYRFMEKSNKDNADKFMEKPWTAAYCNVYARSAIDEIGMFDPVYMNNAEDLDLSKRLSAFGYKSGIAVDAFVQHFGGITRIEYEKENPR